MRDDAGCRIPAADFPVSLYPVEYKHGSVREQEEYQVQLCAQAMCLEEMFHTAIPQGALFFISAHRRQPVLFDAALRRRTRAAAQELADIRHRLTAPAGAIQRQMPPLLSAGAVYAPGAALAAASLLRLGEEARGAIGDEEERE